jgi:hypothetical protein
VALFEREPELLEPLPHLREAPRLENVHQSGVVVGLAVLARVLTQVPDGAATEHRPGNRCRFTREHAQQARLAGPVPTDDPDLVAEPEGKRQPLDDRPAGHLDAEPTYLQDVHGDLHRRRRQAVSSGACSRFRTRRGS